MPGPAGSSGRVETGAYKAQANPTRGFLEERHRPRRERCVLTLNQMRRGELMRAEFSWASNGKGGGLHFEV